MNKILLKVAIQTGLWYECYVKSINGWAENDVFFKIKIIDFEKIKLEEVDDLEKVAFDKDESVLWILRLEIINMSKKTISAGGIASTILLVDDDDFAFDCFTDSHLLCSSEYGKNSGIQSVYLNKLKPKIKAKGAIPYILPDQNSEYYLSILDGTIKEA